MRGRKPQPPALHRARGNPGKRGYSDAEPQPPKELPDPPPHLSEIARAEWDRCRGDAARHRRTDHGRPRRARRLRWTPDSKPFFRLRGSPRPQYRTAQPTFGRSVREGTCRDHRRGSSPTSGCRRSGRARAASGSRRSAGRSTTSSRREAPRSSPGSPRWRAASAPTGRNWRRRCTSPRSPGQRCSSPNSTGCLETPPSC
jgi:hypothetical protein